MRIGALADEFPAPMRKTESITSKCDIISIQDYHIGSKILLLDDG